MIKNVQNVLQVLSDMAGLELALAALYRACSEAFPEDTNFWMAIARQEEVHAQSIEKIRELVSRDPQAFEVNRSFNSVAIGRIRASIDDYISRIQSKDLNRYRTLIIARDIEQSVLETNYGEFLKTSNVQYMTVFDTLTKDTSAHKGVLAAKIARTLPG